MNLDDEVRRHLRDTGEQVALTPGLVDAVRVRAATRARHRRLLFSGLSSLVAVALVGGLLAVLFGGSDQDPTSLEVAALAETASKSEDSQGETTQDSEAQASIASTSPTYETVPLATDNESQSSALLSKNSAQADWIEVTGPVPGASTEYVYSGDTVLGHVGTEWFVRDESSWRQLDLPDSLDVIAVDLGVGEDFLRVGGWLGDDLCSRELVIQVKNGNQWEQYEIPDQLAPGVVSSVSGARLRVTDHELAMSRIEEIAVDPVCLLQSLGIDAVEAEIVDDLVYATDPKAGRVIYSLSKFGPLEAQEFISSGPSERSLLVRSTGGGKWTTTPLPDYEVTELGVVDGIIMMEDAEHTVHDGQRLKRTEVIPSDAEQLIDALVTSSGMSMLFERDEKIWLRDTDGEHLLSQVSDQPVLWGRLGRVSAEVTIVVETQQGQALWVSGQ